MIRDGFVVESPVLGGPMRLCFLFFFLTPAMASSPVVHKAVLFSNLCATTDYGGKVAVPGPRGNWVTRPSDPYCALPDPDLLGKTVLIRSRKTGKIVAFPVWDKGPFSTKDRFVAEHRRPWAESGYSNKYDHVPKTHPCVDLTPAAWEKLGESANSQYSSRVDLIVITDEVEPRVSYNFD